jgi:predicted O-linked N-acetylglucosamine transferase (SPINDLY family)
MIPVLERHDRSAVEVYCYSTGSKVDEYTHRLSKHADVWRPVASLSRSELADAIHRDGIDILIDIAGHSGTPQLEVFAQQPAPVQVTWLGYQNTTGLTRIQYRLCDACTDPPGKVEHLHSETVVRLPHSLWCYRPVLSIDHATEPPVKRNGFITFGSFNDAPKISGATRRLWSEILVCLPDARLLVVGVPEGRAKEGLLRDFSEAGIAASRINIVPRVPLDQYLRRFDAVDISLDTTPYSGHTTTCDTLWMGVPVITLPGSRSVSRGAASILTTVGLVEWIAPSAEEYVRRAVEYAGKPEALAGLRAALRGRLRASPLMDEEGFVRNLESAYRQMWCQWCEGSQG